MNQSALAAVAFASAAAGGVAYVFIYPMLSGEARAEKRQKALIGAGSERKGGRGAQAGANRREQVAQSLKELEARQKTRDRVTLETKIARAGLSWTRGRFHLVSGGVGLALGFLLLLLTASPILALAGVFAGSLGLPQWVLAFLKKRRVGKFLNELPNAMDVIVRGIRSGLPLGDCVRMIANEAQEPLRSEFRAIVESQSLGIPMGESVAKLYERVPVPEANFFGIVISIQQKSGGSLSEALGNLSRVLRDRKRMKGKIKAMSMEAKASAAIIAALPFAVAVLTYLSSPAYIELLWTTQTGKVALAAAAVWMSIGVFVMKKMISFDF
jgi:tight adherence protein B